jgi:hypothetical protein
MKFESLRYGTSETLKSELSGSVSSSTWEGNHEEMVVAKNMTCTLRFEGREPLMIGSARAIAGVEAGCGEGSDSKS